MGMPKRRPKETAKERQMAYMARDIKKKQPPRDYTWCFAFAEESGFNLADIEHEFDYRAAIREYDANVTRHEAEALAESDTREYFERKLGAA